MSMQIDSSIPLKAQAADPLNALAQGYQLGNAIRQQPMQDKLNKQKLDAGEIDLQNAKLKQQESVSSMAKTMFQSDYYGAEQIAPYLDAGDMDSVTRTIEQRRQAKQVIGMPTDTEDGFLAQLQKDPTAAKATLAKVLENGRRVFGKAQAQAKPQIYKDDTATWALMPDGTRQRLGGLPPTGAQQSDYYTTISTPQGTFQVNTRVPGEVVQLTGPDGKPLVRSQDSPDLQRQISEQKKFGSEIGQYNADTATGAGQAKQKADMLVSQIDNVISTTNDVLSNADWSTVGATGVVMSKVPGTPAYDLAKEITTIKSNLGFDRLQQMRDASPTGGALGAVAVQELEGLQSTLASLDQGQSPQQIRANLKKIKFHYENWREAVLESYQRRYEQPNGPVPPRPGENPTTENMNPNPQGWSIKKVQ